MRIDLFNTSAASQAAGQASPNKVKAQSAPASEVSDGGDRTTLTSVSGSIGPLVSEAMSSPELREDKVQSLQQAISSGQYQLDPDKIAGAMIDEHA
jgi:negative regulator of flagellin synthesis FlgM